MIVTLKKAFYIQIEEATIEEFVCHQAKILSRFLLHQWGVVSVKGIGENIHLDHFWVSSTFRWNMVLKFSATKATLESQMSIWYQNLSASLSTSLCFSLPNDRHVYKLSDLLSSCFISLLPRFELVMTWKSHAKHLFLHEHEK